VGHVQQAAQLADAAREPLALEAQPQPPDEAGRRRAGRKRRRVVVMADDPCSVKDAARELLRLALGSAPPCPTPVNAGLSKAGPRGRGETARDRRSGKKHAGRLSSPAESAKVAEPIEERRSHVQGDRLRPADAQGDAPADGRRAQPSRARRLARQAPLYIAFDTQHPGVDMARSLREQYPGEMTIVLQDWFEDLAVMKDRFSVTLNFSDVRQSLVIPFMAVKVFADPSVEIGWRFEGHEAEEEADAEEERDPPAPTPIKSAAEGEVVSLDQFRKH
jgi:hypothetical protein